MQRKRFLCLCISSSWPETLPCMNWIESQRYEYTKRWLHSNCCSFCMGIANLWFFINMWSGCNLFSSLIFSFFSWEVRFSKHLSETEEETPYFYMTDTFAARFMWVCVLDESITRRGNTIISMNKLRKI